MAKRYKNILFDLDGTLTDSAEGVTKSVQFALKKFGIDSSPEELKSFIGPPLRQSFQDHYGFSQAQALQAVNYYRDYFRRKGIFQNMLYPSVTEMLAELTAAGARLYVATSKPTIFAEEVLENFKIKYFFSVIAGSNLDGTRVEKSEVIAYTLKRIKDLNRPETVMVGDRKHDIEGAHTCRIASVAVAYGYGSLIELEAAKPDHVIYSTKELTGFLLS